MFLHSTRYLSLCALLIFGACSGKGNKKADTPPSKPTQEDPTPGPEKTPPENTTLKVLETYPKDGATDIPTNNEIKVTFSKAIKKVTAAQFELTPKAQGSYNTSDRTATFKPSHPLAHNQTYTVRIRNVVDGSGKKMEGEHTWSFSTSAQANKTHPKVVKVSHNGKDVPLTNILEIDFDKEISSARVIVDDGHMSTPVVGTVSDKKASFHYKLKPGMHYKVTLDEAFDHAHNPIEKAYHWEFTVAQLVLAVKEPRVARKANGEVFIVIQFNQDIHFKPENAKFSMQSNAHIDLACKKEELDIIYCDQTNSGLSSRPKDGGYNVNIDKDSIETKYGTKFPSDINFNVILTTPKYEGFTLDRTSPRNLRSPIRIRFDSDIWVENQDVIVKDNAGNVIPGNVGGGQNEMIWEPSQDLSPITEHTITLNHEILDESGALQKSKEWKFTTPNHPDLSLKEAAPYGDVYSGDGIVYAQFSHTVKVLSLKVLRGDKEITLNLNKSENPSTITSDSIPEKLVLNEKYRVKIQLEKSDTVGWDFRFVGISFSPANHAIGIDATAPISAEFSLDLASDACNKLAIAINERGNDKFKNLESSYMKCEKNGNTLIISRNEDKTWTAGRTYKITFKTDLLKEPIYTKPTLLTEYSFTVDNKKNEQKNLQNPSQNQTIHNSSH